MAASRLNKIRCSGEVEGVFAASGPLRWFSKIGASHEDELRLHSIEDSLGEVEPHVSEAARNQYYGLRWKTLKCFGGLRCDGKITFDVAAAVAKSHGWIGNACGKFGNDHFR